ncbi:hypothetical protein QGN23_12000 [Chryseobacterium gotjawalense]|uniref:Uncharacterized protein n=1 Tax=Chryseobacterium gotjawalense TaxID=3042315 RepID=A0ABY8RB00_9FLAO|nr:hypothetical protein [Chryseobacterium sp. wdc7]WHF51146.1 hypothetical protein QGN23_12000 [Chryseobacterium sp. wdc7]
MKKIHWLLLFCFFVNISCISDEERQRQVNSGYQGKWIGSFTGDDTGIITFNVKKEGTLEGNLSSTTSGFSENFEGYVNFNGKFDVNTKAKYYFSGYLDNVKPLEGQWTQILQNGTAKGTFTLKKQ